MKIFAILVFLIADVGLLVRTLGDRGSMEYPLLLSQGLMIALLALFLVRLVQVLREMRALAPAGGETAGENGPDLRAVAMMVAWMALCLGYIALWNVIGYLASTVAFMIGMLALARERNPLVLVGMCAVFPVVVWWLFGEFLKVPLP